MIQTKNALARFLLVNDINGKSVLTKKEFLKFENTFENHDLSGVFDMRLDELLDKTTKKNAEKIYLALRSDCLKIQKQLENLNINVICKKDELFFPQKLVEKLGDEAPILLYVIGNFKLLNQCRVAVTGSRELCENARNFAIEIGKIIAENGDVLVSGGAKGSDIIATKSTLKAGGRAVWFNAVPLIEIIEDEIFEKEISEGRLCVCTDFNPFGRFKSENALRRNKYIYANSDLGFVCQCKQKYSGTFSGASYSLEHNLTELFVFDNGYEAETQLIDCKSKKSTGINVH